MTVMSCHGVMGGACLQMAAIQAGCYSYRDCADNPMGNAAMAMTLNSSVFKQNGHIPSKYTCEGEDVSPPLAWEGVPTGC